MSKVNLNMNKVADLILIPNKENMSYIPSELRKGKIRIGTTDINGIKEEVYFNEDNDKNLIVIGKVGSGKCEYLKNYVHDGIVNEKLMVNIDYVNNIDLGDLQKKLVEEDKMIVVDLDDPNFIQSLSFNELNYKDTDSSIEKIENIQEKSYRTLDLLDSISSDRFSNSMKRYFITASKIVYSVDNNASIQNIIDFLEDESVRDKFLNKIPEDLKEYLDDEIYTAKRMNTPSHRHLALDEILDRIYMLKQNMTIRMMMKKTSENNIDFIKCLEDGKSIFIRTNRGLYSKELIEVLNLFFIEKVDIASTMRTIKSREDTKKIHFVINDELNSDKVIKKLGCIIPTSRVNNLKLIIGVQSLDKIERTIHDTGYLGFNYMFLSGADKCVFRKIRNLTDIRFDDNYDIPKYHSINLIMNEQYKYDLFVTKLPQVLEPCNIK